MKKAELARRSGVSVRHIYHALNKERGVSIEIVDELARPFGLAGYHLQMPNFDPDLLKTGKFDELFDDYAHADTDGRTLIEEQARYMAKRKDGGANDPNGPAEKKKGSGT